MKMTRTVLKMAILYGAVLAIALFALQWLEYRYFLKNVSTNVYVAMLATLFISLGIWVGHKLTTRPAIEPFVRNDPALQSLGISARELEVLEAIAAGQSNKEIARELGISPNTIKTHIAHIFEKLSVDRRVLAIEKARSLYLIP
ncbi:LuxR C-terminal-related transcriptional regulator [Parasphingorhabdus sp.]|uniref:response regulator transcription factor n=1 Tax=Parasphingorhabdus sp. TaxID=2709688 RepID=UPI0032651A97